MTILVWILYNNANVCKASQETPFGKPVAFGTPDAGNQLHEDAV